MGKSKNPPPTESLVYKSWLAHGAIQIAQAARGRDPLWDIPDVKFAFFPADQYGPIDTIMGADTLLCVRLEIPRRRKGSNDIYIIEDWQWIPIQIKGGAKCTFAVLPLPDPLPESIKSRLCPRFRRKAYVHYQRHRTINSVIFVPKVSETDPDFAKVLDEIWAATLRLVNTRFEIIGLKYRVK